MNDHFSTSSLKKSYLEQDSSSSDSDLLKNNPIWPPRPRSPNKDPPMLSPQARPLPADPSLSDSARSISSQEADDAARGKLFQLH